MQKIDLTGKWDVQKRGETDIFPATVPGCIHTDLLQAGKIDDPFYRDNESKQFWISETDWVYSRTFDADHSLLDNDVVVLRCESLDTLATVSVNGKEIARTDNQFRIWEFDIKDVLRNGVNKIEIVFESTIPYIEERQKERYLYHTGINHHRIEGSNRIRRSQCNYGWDWGPMCATCGILRPIEITAYSTGRIGDVHIGQDHSRDGQVTLAVKTELSLYDTADVTLTVSSLSDGKEVASEKLPASGRISESKLVIENPKLWWPNGMGEQPLYDITVVLTDGEGKELDRVVKRTGLRTVKLDRHPDEWGESFQFVVNGIPMFAKGANWIPADQFVTRITDNHYEHLISSTAAANMNMLRIWGGGIFENPIFYDLCDKYGILLWHDFMFACSAYAAYDEEFMESVACEIEDNVKILRHHPSIAFWCGNNELEQIPGMVDDDTSKGAMSWDEYKSLFDDLIPTIIKRLDPQRDYWPSSPHSPCGDRKDFNNPTCGDAHLWSVWHGRQPFEWYRTCDHRFNSEFGFQSFPEPKVVYGFTEPGDRNVSGYIMEYHQRSNNAGNDAITQYMLSWFQMPKDLPMFIWLSQILQGMAMKYAVEHWRRSMPRGMGTLYWQLNDTWPGPSWASIDYFGNWKALQYMAREFNAPVLLSGVEDTEKGSVELHITSDLTEEKSGTVSWVVTDAAGNVVEQDSRDYPVLPLQDKLIETLSVADLLAEYGARNLLVWLKLEIDGKEASSNLVTLARPKHIELKDPTITPVIVERSSGVYELTLTTDAPALWVWPDFEGIDVKYSNRFFHMRPGLPVTIVITADADTNSETMRKKLTVSSLVDTFDD